MAQYSSDKVVMQMNRSLNIIIHRPQEEVFKFVATDYFDSMPKWSLAHEQLYKLSEDPIHIGSIAKLKTECGNCDYESILLVTDYQPSRRMVIEETSQSLRSSV